MASRVDLERLQELAAGWPGEFRWMAYEDSEEGLEYEPVNDEDPVMVHDMDQPVVEDLAELINGGKAAIAELAAERSSARKLLARTRNSVRELLAAAPVIEVRTLMGWHQMRANGDQRAWDDRARTWGSWGGAYHAEVSFEESTLNARIVPSDQANDAPSSRGPL